MATKKDSGVFKNKNGLWYYRFSIIVDGQRVSKKKTTDENGNKLLTKKAAIAAREAAIFQAQTERKRTHTISKRTVRNHIDIRFGKRYVDEIPVADINDYLADLYYTEGLAFRYVESFLKMFYLIFGQAYSRDYLDVDTYNKLCVNKDTKIHMPKMKTEDDTDIVAFSREELLLLDEYFKGTNQETAYLLGKYCGLRINECFGLKWDHVDIKKGTITIDRQMQYQQGLIKLVPLKTRNAKRTVYMNENLKVYFQKLFEKRMADEINYSRLREQNQRMIDDLDGARISSTELVNCLFDGKIQTVNSMKYPTREIKNNLHIEFKYHYLRHTYGTLMAEMNTPQHLLCNQMGHGNINVTQRYYLSVTKTGVDVLKENLNLL